MTHWTWVVCLFFLLFSGLQIFNAHPTLYIGEQSGFTAESANSVLDITALRRGESVVGETGRERNSSRW